MLRFPLVIVLTCGGTAVFLGAFQEVLEGILGGGLPFTSSLYRLLFKRTCGDAVVYPSVNQGVLGGDFRGFCFLPHVSKMYSSKEI